MSLTVHGQEMVKLKNNTNQNGGITTTKKQHIQSSIETIEKILELAIMAQDSCGNYGDTYRYCEDIEMKCKEWLKDMGANHDKT